MQQNLYSKPLTALLQFKAMQAWGATQFKAVLRAIDTLPKDKQPQIIGLAPTHREVSEMQTAGVDAKTLAAFLYEESQKITQGEKPDYHNTLFVIDEAAVIGNIDMAKTYHLIAAGNGRAVMSGDSAQLQPISPGKPFRLQQQRSAIDNAVMKEDSPANAAIKTRDSQVDYRQHQKSYPYRQISFHRTSYQEKKTPGYQISLSLK